MKRKIFNLYMSYDGSGFEEALSHLSKGEREEVLTTEMVSRLLEQYIADGIHDWMAGHCETFEIFDQDGNLFFQFAPAMKEAA